MTTRRFMTDTVRPVALALIAVGFGSLLALILRVFLGLDLPRLYATGITFLFAALAAFYLFPRRLKLPFGHVGVSEYLRRLGFCLPRGAWKHALLGALLAACTLSGMLIGSLLSGRYQVDWSTVNVVQTVFSINPGIWEEFFFRGVVMLLLLRATRSLWRAVLIQILVFGLAHIKGLDLWAWVDVISVMIIAVAFTYTAYKTRTLVAGIVFHFLHDALLFLPQLPGGEYVGVLENAAYFGSLWVMVGVACVLVWISSDRLGVKAEAELYRGGT
jgi:membrane protease YdiL (CAAX protease family)